MNFTVTLNGKKQIIQASPSDSLMLVLRRYNLLSVKLGCGKGSCGSCTVLFNGKPVPSCKIPVALAMNQEIETLEHFSEIIIFSVNKSYPLTEHRLQLWVEHNYL